MPASLAFVAEVSVVLVVVVSHAPLFTAISKQQKTINNFFILLSRFQQKYHTSRIEENLSSPGYETTQT
ncbi:hypothetical protein AGMMS49953_03560 [Endomicrobiia bacterium]|nr:hypothetical protein AGMMS49953_03560 [Endomicrobiia bacterium]